MSNHWTHNPQCSSRLCWPKNVKVICTLNQISANNSTTLRYSKITRYSAINRCWILGQFGGYNLTRVILKSELKKLAFTICAVNGGKMVITRSSILVWTVIFERFLIGLVFVLRLNTIFGFNYWASTQPRSQTFMIRLENKSRVGTPLRQNLFFIKVWPSDPEADDIPICQHASLSNMNNVSF